jgi:hypothetical protein
MQAALIILFSFMASLGIVIWFGRYTYGLGYTRGLYQGGETVLKAMQELRQKLTVVVPTPPEGSRAADTSELN